jgi:hypothetical protein
MNYKGVIIEESLEDTSLLKEVKILKTKTEQVIDTHKTPWLKQWTLDTVEIPENNAEEIASEISHSFDREHPNWYADFKNDMFHYIIFANKVFKIDLSQPEQYQQATKYGISIGIPSYQVDFAPEIKEWKRE